MTLHGKDCNIESKEKGGFTLVASNGNGPRPALIGNPDGKLIWNSKNIVRSVNNITADANGNVDIPIPVIIDDTNSVNIQTFVAANGNDNNYNDQLKAIKDELYDKSISSKTWTEAKKYPVKTLKTACQILQNFRLNKAVNFYINVKKGTYDIPRTTASGSLYYETIFHPDAIANGQTTIYIRGCDTNWNVPPTSKTDAQVDDFTPEFIFKVDTTAQVAHDVAYYEIRSSVSINDIMFKCELPPDSTVKDYIAPCNSIANTTFARCIFENCFYGTYINANNITASVLAKDCSFINTKYPLYCAGGQLRPGGNIKCQNDNDYQYSSLVYSVYSGNIDFSANETVKLNVDAKNFHYLFRAEYGATITFQQGGTTDIAKDFTFSAEKITNTKYLVDNTRYNEFSTNAGIYYIKGILSQICIQNKNLHDIIVNGIKTE